MEGFQHIFAVDGVEGIGKAFAIGDEMLAVQGGEMFWNGFFAQGVVFSDVGYATGALLYEGAKYEVSCGVVQWFELVAEELVFDGVEVFFRAGHNRGV